MVTLKRCSILQDFICSLIVISLLFGTLDVVNAGSPAHQRKTRFGKGRILDINGNYIHFSWIDIGKPLFVYGFTRSSRDSTIQAERVIRVEVRRSHALEGFLLGGIATFGIILVVGRIAKQRGGWETDWGSVPPGLAAGALIGAFIGWCKPKYVTVYGFHKSE
jgi:hypothetical protein